MWRRSVFSSVDNILEAAFQAKSLNSGSTNELHILLQQESRLHTESDAQHEPVYMRCELRIFMKVQVAMPVHHYKCNDMV
jgi:hypothetical protein